VSKPDLFKLLEKATIEWSGEVPVTILPLPISGSTRQYFRIKLKDKSIVGVWSDDKTVNKVFVYFTEHFRKLGLNVPELLYVDLNNDLYLLEDLGDETLYSVMIRKSDSAKGSASSRIPGDASLLYCSALKHLIRFQLDGPKGVDFSYCIPRPVYDEQSILWDLQYFKYYVLKLFNIPFDEQRLEEDFIRISRLLVSVENKYFMYRDFQSRNILIYKKDLYFVDYQGGMQGPLYYDLASLLFESRVNLSPEFREDLIYFYINELSGRIKIDCQEFLGQFYLFVFLRVLQVLAAYGLRGYAQNKSVFLGSYPFAVDNLEWLLDKGLVKFNAPEVIKAVEKVVSINEIREVYEESERLNIQIRSFSFKSGIPKDFSGIGGGFVFDCRILPNPGRYPEFREMIGTDEPVTSFLEKSKEVSEFLGNVRNIMDIAIKDYLERGMNRLMVSFGCTGGQHRSIYCAAKTAEYISKKYNIKTTLVHGYFKHTGK